MLGRFGARLWLTPAKESAYRQAWRPLAPSPGCSIGIERPRCRSPGVGEVVAASGLPKLEPARLRVPIF